MQDLYELKPVKVTARVGWGPWTPILGKSYREEESLSFAGIAPDRLLMS